MTAVFGIITGVCFAWGCIATAIAIGYAKMHETADAQAAGWKLAYDEERDRAAANSLSEYRAWHPVAMTPSEPEEQKEYGYDPTGLIRSTIDTRDVQ